MKPSNHPPLWEKIDRKIDHLFMNLVKVQTAPQKRPQWVQNNPKHLEIMLQRHINHIIAAALTEQAKMIRSLPPAQHRALIRSTSDYSKLKSAEIAKTLLPKNLIQQNENQKDANNKRMINATKLMMLWIWLLEQNLEKQRKKKLRKKLLQLMAIQEKRSQQSTESNNTDDKPPDKGPQQAILLVNPSSSVSSNMADYQIAKCLHHLGLGVGASRKEIEQAFKAIKENFIIDYANNPEKNYQDDPDYQLALDAYHKLTKVSDERLAKLSQITDTEIKDLVNNLNPLSPNLLAQEVTLKQLETLIIESELAELQKTDSSTPSTKTQKMHLTLEKLANHFAAEPNRPILLNQFLAEEINQHQNTHFSPRPSLGS